MGPGKIMKQLYGNTNARDGWLDRQGRFHPCEFNHHLSMVYKLQKKLGLKNSLEYLGWIKVHSAGAYFFKADEYYGRQYVKITNSQQKWLLDNGYEIEE